MSDEIWMLQSRRQLTTGPGDWYWTGRDYTQNAAFALRFTSQVEADRWLRVRSYLKPLLKPVQVFLTEGQSK